MFKAIWTARWFVVLGVLTFIFVLVINTPLHFVWRYVEPQAGRLPLKIEQVSGTLWEGRMRFAVPQLRDLGSLDARWQLSPLALLAGRADFDFSVLGDGVRLKSAARIGLDQQLQILGADGYLNADKIQRLLSRNRVSVAGEFELNRLLASINLQTRQFSDVSGRLVYSGGEVGFPVDNKPIRATMPMLIGTLGMEPEKAVLNIETTEGQALIQGFMQQDGWGGIAIRRRFLDVLGQKWPAEATEETVIFEVSHKVL